jgi:L-alanine-DL-glutamate epimerase-like enolase superfamily enzyme
MRTARGEFAERTLLQVRVTGDDGIAGHGEAAPLPGYDGSDVDSVERALRSYEPVLAAAERRAMHGAQILDACRAIDPIPQALAAIDLALWDRAGRREGRPVASLLTDTPAARVTVNATLTALDRAGVAAQAQDAAGAGFSCIKVKVGVGDDAGRVAAARAAAGPEMDLRLDANGAWDVDQAVRSIEVLAPAGLELVEEPTRGLDAVRRVRERVPVRIAIDETSAEPGALGAGVADAVCLKVSRCGGIAALLAAATLVRAAGADAYLASTLDGPLGIAAALHAAAALASRGELPACGLATLGLFEGLPDPFPPSGGAIALPTAPGLGVDPL